MKTWTYVVGAICAVALFCAQSAYGASSEMEILLKKLQEKGILTESEAQEIAAETKKAAEEEKAQPQETAAKTAAQAVEAKETPTETVETKKAGGAMDGLPDWIKNTKFSGDLRLRYEDRDREDDGRGTQGRGRFRLRAGLTTEITDDIEVGFSLAGGTGDQRSANQTLGGAFDRKDVWIDTAYARYTPTPWFSVIGGKFVNPIWQPSDMLFWSDLNPEGAAMRLQGPVASNFALFLNSAFYVVEDRNAGGTGSSASFPSAPGGAPDPLMYVFQPGFKWDFTKDTFLRFAPAYYVTSNFKGELAINPTNDPLIPGAPANSFSGTNTLTKSGKYAYNYSVIDWGAELGFNKPFGVSWIPYFGIMAGFSDNPSPSKNNEGYLMGFSVGSTDVVKFGDWAFEYTFRRIEKDAWLDFLTDPSFYKGATNAMGHRLRLLLGLAKNTALGLNFYDTWQVRNFSPVSSLAIPGSTRTLSSEEYLGQVDIYFRF